MVSTALLTLIYLSFISLGLPDSVLGSAWPAMTVSLNAPLWGAGLIQMLISFCTIISSLNSARLIRKFGTGRLTAISVATTALALLGFSLAKNYAFLLLMAVPLGLGAGAVDAGLNNYVALHCEAKHMSWLHCFWGVGTIIGPMILSAVLRVGGSWTTGLSRGGTDAVRGERAAVCDAGHVEAERHSAGGARGEDAGRAGCAEAAGRKGGHDDVLCATARSNRRWGSGARRIFRRCAA